MGAAAAALVHAPPGAPGPDRQGTMTTAAEVSPHRPRDVLAPGPKPRLLLTKAGSGRTCTMDVSETDLQCGQHSIYFFMGGELELNVGDQLVGIFVDYCS